MSNLRYSDYYDAKDRAARIDRLLAKETCIDADRRAAIHAFTQAQERPGFVLRVTCKTPESLHASFRSARMLANAGLLLLKSSEETNTIELTNGSAIEFCIEPPAMKEGAA